MLHNKFKIKDLGELKFFLEIEFSKNRSGIVMRQKKYSQELISDLGLSDSEPYGSPVDLSHKLTSVEFDEHTGSSSNNDSVLSDPIEYQNWLGDICT